MIKKPRLEALKKQIARLPKTGSGKRQRYPEELKEAVVALVEEGRRQGQTQASVADALGIHATMISCWKKESRRESGPRVGKVREVRVDEAREREGSRALVLPNGARIEGLELEELVVLVQELI